MIHGNFIVFEGIDGAGTTTQARELRKRFLDIGLPGHVTAEPSAGPIGSLIRQVLIGRVVVRMPHGVSSPSWKTMALLFGADRQDHVESEIVPNLMDGVNVICDRYLYSSVIYQSVSSEDDDAVRWIEEVNRYARRPDLVFYLRVDPAEAERRRRNRTRDMEIYDDAEFQSKLAGAYDRLPELFPDVNVITVDGNRAIDDVAQDCWDAVETLRSSGAAT